ncbi:MAG: energy transducer TonB [Sandaracinus sp.]|nr:energy transducer TonB [Sandaracinus sp.]MCB9614742.1 energy transducer TonB [Sandaracinus sp.]MCB9632891.1 energy transducer TonB [Sandaracinus sp.]
MASETPSWLRIAIVRDDRIVDERWYADGPVTIGDDERATLVDADVPLRTLFESRGDRWVLHLGADTEGRVGVGGQVVELATLLAVGATHRLDRRARGRVRVGSSTLLFEVTDRRVVTPRAPLPTGAIGGLFTQIDARFTTFVVASFTAFFGLVIFLESADFPIATGRFSDERIARLVFSEPAPPPEPPPDDVSEVDPQTTTPEVTRHATNTSTPRPTSRTDNGPARDNGPSAEARARIAADAMRNAESLLLGALGEGGAMANVLLHGAPTANAEEVLGDASGVDRAISAVSHLRAGDGGGSGEEGDLGNLRRQATVATIETPGPARERVLPGIRLERVEPVGGSGDFDPSVAARAMRARLSAFRRCYETVLRREPTLAGRWVVELRITERGTVDRAAMVERSTPSEALESCVLEAVRRVRVHPAPVGGDVELQYPLVFAPQN